MTSARQNDFWSRRRALVQAEAETEAQHLALAERQAQEAALAEQSDAEILATLDLPDPDTLIQGDDFAAFMRAAVPERLRRRALRRLWRSNPVLANLDGLVDHGEDFSDAATVVPGMATAYQVGKGMMRHVLALEEAKDPEPEAEVPDEVLLAEAEEVEADLEVAPETDAPPEAAAPPRRHMRFAFAPEQEAQR